MFGEIGEERKLRERMERRGAVGWRSGGGEKVEEEEEEEEKMQVREEVGGRAGGELGRKSKAAENKKCCRSRRYSRCPDSLVEANWISLHSQRSDGDGGKQTSSCRRFVSLFFLAAFLLPSEPFVPPVAPMASPWALILLVTSSSS